MQTVELTDVYKASAEVASLGSSDRVLVADSNGVQKRIDKTFGMVKSVDAPNGTWIRIGRTNGHGNSAQVLFSVTQGWSNHKPQSALLSACMSSGNYDASKTEGTVNVLSSTVTRISLTKARLIVADTSRNSAYVYLDIYQGCSNKTNSVHVISADNFIVDISNDATIPDGYEAKEFDLTASVLGGGVNDYSSISYAILQKGGLRDGDGRAYQCLDNGESDRRNDRERLYHEHRLLQDHWHLYPQNERCYVRESSRDLQLELRDTGGHKSRKLDLLSANNHYLWKHGVSLGRYEWLECLAKGLDGSTLRFGKEVAA